MINKTIKTIVLINLLLIISTNLHAQERKLKVKKNEHYTEEFYVLKNNKRLKMALILNSDILSWESQIIVQQF